MPLFESQTSRNERWFGAAQHAAHRILHEEFSAEPELSTHVAWAEGGLYLARFGVEYLTILKEPWGKGTIDKALSLTRVFVQPMISSWYRAISSNRPEEDRSRAVQLAAMNMLTLLGDHSQQAITDFLNLDLQYNHEWDQHEQKGDNPGIFTYELLIDKALVACGKPPAIDWRLQTFPVKQSSDLVWAASPRPPNMRDMLMWPHLLGQAEAPMFKTFEVYDEARKQARA